jgi:hypothetical protein
VSESSVSESSVSESRASNFYLSTYEETQTWASAIHFFYRCHESLNLCLFIYKNA